MGISSDYHDASAALVVDGRVIAAAAEERFTRVRHDASFPSAAIEACLASAQLLPGDIDLVAYYEDPSDKFSRILATTIAEFPFSIATFTDAVRRWLGEKLWIKERLAKHFGVSSARVLPLSHHLSHASQSFLQSPFRESAIVTLDAVGEWTCSAISAGSRHGRTAQVTPVLSVDYPHSLGLFYSAFTRFLGFRPNSDECSTMALSAFGSPRYVDRVRDVLTVNADGTHALDQRYIQALDAQSPFSAPFVARFGEPRSSAEPWPFDVHAPGAPADERSQYHADLAASVQAVLEEAVVAFAKRAREATGSANLCLSGGVALNCVAVARLLEAGLFEDIFIPSEPGDGGAALGAALHGAALRGELDDDRAAASPFLGQPPVPFEWSRFLPELQRGIAAGGLARFDWHQVTRLEERITEAASALAAGKIVGWHVGRTEFGPRALGNRSILAAPHDVELARRISRRVKRRAAFRPYALAASERYALEAFELGTRVPRCARWMQTVVRARPEHAAQLRGGLHVDDTTRLQVCEEEDNPALAALLRAYGAQSGVEALINTSLNLRGEPIVETPLESLSLFMRSDLDVLVVEDYVLWKMD